MEKGLKSMRKPHVSTILRSLHLEGGYGEQPALETWAGAKENTPQGSSRSEERNHLINVDSWLVNPPI